MKTKVTNLPSMQSRPMQYPQPGDDSPFAGSKRLQFGTLRIMKDRIIANNGTVDSITLDSSGLHAYNNSSQEVVRVNYLGFHGYTTAGVEMVRVDATGLHGYDASGNELLNINNTGTHYYNTSAVELIKVDGTGLHVYDASANEIVKVSQTGFQAYNTVGNELVRVSSDGFHGYDTGGTEKVSVNASGLGVYGTGGNALLFKNTVAGTTYGAFGYNSGAGGMYVVSSNTKMNIGSATSGVEFNATTAAMDFYCGTGLEGAYFDGDVTILNDCDIGGALAKGSGTFKIQHPLKKDNYLVHGFSESPDHTVFYRGKDKIGKDGKVIIKLPNYLSALVKKEDITVNLTCLNGFSELWTEEVLIDEFIVHGKSGSEFFWRVEAVRNDDEMYRKTNPSTLGTGRLIPEPLKIEFDGAMKISRKKRNIRSWKY